MADVKDTATFIEAARAIHGDKYDYEKTVFVSPNDKITIICRICGRSCGCRGCKQEAALIARGAARHCDCCGKRVKYNTNKRCKDCCDVLNDDWCVALSKSMSKLKSKAKRNNMDGWFRWAKNKGCIITNRKPLTPVIKLRSVVGSWEAWEFKQQKKQVERKGEDRWTKRLRHWAWALSQREKRQDEKSLEV